MNWKAFKTWLDQNIIQVDGYQAKIKPEQQKQYGQISIFTLTNFCDSLEATLDKNNTYHLFPVFQANKTFTELFSQEKAYFGKKTNQQKISKNDYDLLAKLFASFQNKEKPKTVINSLTELLKQKYPSSLTKRIELDEQFFSKAQQFPHETLDFSYYSDLEQIISHGKGEIKRIDVSRNQNLTELIFPNNQLTKLNLSNNPKLIVLNVNNNQLASLNLDNNLYLEYVDVTNNEIQDTWIINKCRNIKFLACRNNYLNGLRLHVNLRNVLVNSEKSLGRWINIQPQKHDGNLNDVKKERIHPTYHVYYDAPLENQEEKAKTTNNLPTDTGWLTDNNIEYILNDQESIQNSLTQNLRFRLRTDLANIYFNCEQAKKGENISDFVRELELNRFALTILPLRVLGNHWGLVLVQNKNNEKKFYYLSSFSSASNREEAQQIQPFIDQLSGQTNTTVNLLSAPSRQNNSYDCGVYLIKYIQEILENGNLALSKNITEQDCQLFRQEWKAKIGTNDWCKWDEMNDIRGEQPQLSWKEFHRWLQREIIIQEEKERVKLKTEQQTNYPNLTENALNRFMDSLEATLDKENSFYLFPDYEEKKSFEELFNPDTIFCGKQTDKKKIGGASYADLKKLFLDWKKSAGVLEGDFTNHKKKTN